MGHAGFGHHDLVGAEGIGFHAIAADSEKRLVDFPDHLRTREIQHFRYVLMAEPVSVQVEGPLLQVGAHGAIEHDDTLTGQIEKRAAR